MAETINTQSSEKTILLSTTETNNEESVLNQRVTLFEVWTQDIRGIIYYIDNKNNIYNPEDILMMKVNPEIIGEYGKVGEKYTILSIKDATVESA